MTQSIGPVVWHVAEVDEQRHQNYGCVAAVSPPDRRQRHCRLRDEAIVEENLTLFVWKQCDASFCGLSKLVSLGKFSMLLYASEEEY